MEQPLLSELPKLFGKSFVVGYLLPAVAIAIAGQFILGAFDVETGVKAIFDAKDVLGATFLTFAIWLGAVALMALNYRIIRICEGYGDYNPFRIIKRLQVCEFRKLKAIETAMRQTIERDRAIASATSPLVYDRFTHALRRLATDFPDTEAFLLATKFGNTIRAFEVYSRVAYGLDAIPGWDRLIAVIPKDFREALDDAKSLMDFWLNLWTGAVALLILYGFLAFSNLTTPQPWIPPACIGLAIIFLSFARMQAANWGELVKSAFDLYRNDLAAKLGLDLSRSIEHERAMWGYFSQMTVFRSKDAADRTAPYRKRDPK